MFRMHPYGRRDLPVEISRSNDKLKDFCTVVTDMFPVELSLLNADHLRHAAEFAEQYLLELGLLKSNLIGAVLLHVVRDESPNVLICRTVLVRLQRRKYLWEITRISSGAMFANHPIPSGIILTDHQRSNLLARKYVEYIKNSTKLS